MEQLLTLQAASIATGQPVDRLGNWCATGKLTCQRDGNEWLVPLSAVPLVMSLAVERDEAIAQGLAVAVAVPVATAPPDLPAEIARRLGVPDLSVATSTLALDGREYMIAVWETDGGRSPELAPIVELVESLGGQVLDGELPRSGPAASLAAEPRGG